MQSRNFHRRVKQTDLRLRIYLVVKEHHKQRQFQKGVEKRNKAAKMAAGMQGFILVPEELLVEERCPNVEFGSCDTSYCGWYHNF